jgi:hypothetical protein
MTPGVEEWRDVVGWQSRYEVSSFGRVRSLDRIIIKHNRWGENAPLRLAGRVLATSTHRKGYRVVSLSSQQERGAPKAELVHRLVCEAFNGAPPEGYEVGHLDGSRDNNRASNLAWVRKLQNQSHRTLHGTRQVGENHPQVRLSVGQLAEIRALKGKVMGAALAERFGVSFQHISAIQRGKSRRFD